MPRRALTRRRGGLRVQNKIRNVAIIAHVDHGKTTLVDAMLHQTGVFRANEAVRERVLDSNDLERERGITILAKHASIRWKDYKINLIDTPGHADFGGEVERTLRMADGALLLVDAAEGALPQTRFVLSKCIELDLPVVTVVNKIDRSDARPDEALHEVFDLFCDLGATDEQADFAHIYAIGKDGIAKRELEDESSDLTPLFETLIERLPAPEGDPDAPLQLLVHNTIHDEYVGRIAIGRIRNGEIKPQEMVAIVGTDGVVERKVGALWGFESLERVRITEASAGDIVAISGIEDVHIGDTIALPSHPNPLERISVEQPTIKIRFMVNTSPFAGLAGDYVTSRQVRERLLKEAQRNIAMRVEEGDEADSFMVYGRGELMLAILAETMRREGYEFALGMPEVVVREVDGKKFEPVETVVVDVPQNHVGTVTQLLGDRRGVMVKMSPLGANRSRIEFRVPSRGLIGFRSLFMTETRGEGLLNTMFEGWDAYAGPLLRRKNGAIVSDRKGVTTPYALFNLQPRGKLFAGTATKVYEGMIVGEHNRPSDLDVNCTREKKLTNIRAAGKDENVVLTPHKELTIENALDWIDQDELVEVTPDAVRVRKAILQCNLRPKREAPKKG
ncbi:MAG: translational GTPase TypA [Deltaproteobacteria bacterium]|nr:translational GTPase TypA [Deltaproteobacteria bacterium]NND30643.1 translational GTPase TypA [Myxococcales bacterium]MBT8465750.1 translational GTPase TypA [Deltaproteobacteria bacterium]MBT8482142.1 translational GTPase TypA [Deltaproteobacteria bacterium]NNK08264.1 translational GTPase TypA [Myxococcales bacterium]